MCLNMLVASLAKVKAQVTAVGVSGGDSRPPATLHARSGTNNGTTVARMHLSLMPLPIPQSNLPTIGVSVRQHLMHSITGPQSRQCEWTVPERSRPVLEVKPEPRV